MGLDSRIIQRGNCFLEYFAGIGGLGFIPGDHKDRVEVQIAQELHGICDLLAAREHVAGYIGQPYPPDTGFLWFECDVERIGLGSAEGRDYFKFLYVREIDRFARLKRGSRVLRLVELHFYRR